MDRERQFTHGDFIQACNLELRYATEIYGLRKYVKYIPKHMKIIEKIKERNKCWLVALRYHLAIRLEIFREQLDGKGRKKKHRRGKKSFPKKREKRVEEEARWDTEAAGELKYYETNPYAPGHLKYGVDFFTGRNEYDSESEDEKPPPPPKPSTSAKANATKHFKERKRGKSKGKGGYYKHQTVSRIVFSFGREREKLMFSISSYTLSLTVLSE